MCRAKYEFKIPKVKIFIYFSYIAYDLKSTNVPEHVNHLQTTKFHVHEIK